VTVAGSVRVYLPSTLRALRLAVDAGQIGPEAAGEVSGDGPAGVTAFAVTPALREWYVEGDAEELEYAAMTEAARASLRLLDLDPEAPQRRVVVAADVPESQVTPVPELDRAVVRLSAPVPVRLLAAVHVDATEAEDDVRAAAEAVVAADLGSEDAAFVVDGAEGHELLWFATQEIPDLLRD
jgi:hypothetical protein